MSSSIVALVTFKAGRCDNEATSGANSTKIKCHPTPGYIYIYIGQEDELVHFCWRQRSKPASEPEMDLLMFPGDATFTPYTGAEASGDPDNVTSPASGRIFVLKFSSSSQRHLFWLQSKSQDSNGRPNWFSPRDLKLGQIIDMMLQGAEIDVTQELSEIDAQPPQSNNPDEDHDMDDAEGNSGGNGPRGPRLRANSTGGAGAGATGGDIRREGEGPREGGADGGRAASGNAPTDASALVQNFLNSLGGGSGGKGGNSRQPQQQEKPFCSLSDLLTPDTLAPVINTASASYLDTLLQQLPPAIILLSTRPDDLSDTSVTPAAADEALKTLSTEEKRRVLMRVVRSPQLQQSLASLTVAIRDGGLPSVAEALSVKVEHGGYIRGGAMPLGGGDAVEAFVEGVRRTVKEEEGGDEVMDTS